MNDLRNRIQQSRTECAVFAALLTLSGCAAAGRMDAPEADGRATVPGTTTPPPGVDAASPTGAGEGGAREDAGPPGRADAALAPDAPGSTPMALGTSPVLGQITSGCDAERGDVFSFEASAGQAIQISADTVSDTTKSDLWARLYRSPTDPEGSELVTDDDSLDCTFPVELFGCPEMMHTVDSGEGGTLYIFVGIASDQCADARLSEFSLSVTADGAPVALSLVSDEVHGVW